MIAYLEVSIRMNVLQANKFAGNELCLPRTSTIVF